MPTFGFEKLEQRISDLRALYQDRAEHVVREVGLLVDQVLVLGTPVDTGRARANWLVSFGAPDTSFSPNRFDQGGNATLSQHQPQILSFRIGQEMFISNSVPYIGRLEDGSSAQAPEGMTRDALREATKFLQTRRNFLGAP